MDNEPRQCGMCEHFSVAKPYRWGGCYAPVPIWIVQSEELRAPMIFPDDARANGCELFKRKQSVTT